MSKVIFTNSDGTVSIMTPIEGTAEECAKRDLPDGTSYEVVDDSLLWKIYLWIDNKTPQWLLKYKVNADLYNTYFISELIVESLPQLMMYVVFYVLSNLLLY